MTDEELAEWAKRTVHMHAFPNPDCETCAIRRLVTEVRRLRRHLLAMKDGALGGPERCRELAAAILDEEGT